ncbi:MAG TPA: enolase C-terminal domain-like protein [Acidimicrobiia bacterium]|jgi:muconate cycloisomerase
MKIVSVETFPVSVPLTKPVVMSHITIEKSDNVLVKVTADDGTYGWGEGVEATDITGDTQSRIKDGIDFLAPSLVGADPLRRTELWFGMQRTIQANETAIGAIDIALHDLAGRHHGVPVSELIGGAVRDRVPALTMVGSGRPEADLEAALAKYEAGFRWFKIKLAIADQDTEMETVTKIRTALPADAVVCGDANQGWSEQQAVAFLRKLDGYDVRFVEQPIPRGDHGAMIRVAHQSPIPICADQSVGSFDDILAFGRSGVAGVSLKLVKQAGITGVMRAASLCDTLGLAINLSGKIAESSVAAVANVHCAAAMHRVDFGASPANQGVARDVVTEPVQVVDGHFRVPTAPGLGIEIDESVLG